MPHKWSVLRTKPNSDLIAVQSLNRAGYTCFHPRIKLIDSNRKQFSLFPGYLFVMDAADPTHWSKAIKLPGVLGWLKFDAIIASLSDEIIQTIKKRVQQINIKGTRLKSFYKDQVVRIDSGKFESLAQVLKTPKPTNSKVRVALNFMGQIVNTDIPIKHVQNVSEEMISQFNMRGKRRTRGKNRWINGFGPRTKTIH